MLLMHYVWSIMLLMHYEWSIMLLMQMTNYAFITFPTLNVVPIEYHIPKYANTDRFDSNANLILFWGPSSSDSSSEFIRRVQFRGNSNLETYNVPIFSPLYARLVVPPAHLWIRL